jgi:hypothetical protein
MRLLRARLTDVGPFGDVAFPFMDEEGKPRAVTVVHGGGGVGKTTLLSAIAATRPGYAVVVHPRAAVASAEPSAEVSPEVRCDWVLGQDDAARPHPLHVATPSMRSRAEDEVEAFRRREQTIFDKRAREGGYVLIALPSTRWFSRQPIAITAPAQTMARYDVRAAVALDDASRADLARETKQALAYASIVRALAPSPAQGGRSFELLGESMQMVVDALVSLSGFAYLGVDPLSLEPVFRGSGHRALPFDALPTRARHLVAMAALPVRTLWAAYPGRDPRECEGVVMIDEIDLHQDPVVQAGLIARLRAALPHVQWIVTTTSPTVAGSCDTREVLALRRLPEVDRVELFVGSEARTH